ncbi:uncharacterized protein [Gossypium hirsutum]|uniref:Uncharacterized protein n=1 Tax=Gossypium hirsutum TaxID=3635 RepID=A0A1U8NIE6_GOSHI|nr:uncharacterized protein LOC107947765 [Gossypium hirsutum]
MSATRGARGSGRGRGGVRAESSTSGHTPNVGVEEDLASPVAETGPYDWAARDDALSQPPRGGQLSPRSCGQARGGNDNERGRGAPGGDAGHTEARQPALVYGARHREDRDAPDVITGMFFIHELPYTALIDIGSTHSYVACNMTEPSGNMFEITANEITMISLLGQSVGVNKLFREVPLVVQGFTFLVDLMELPFSEFDLVLDIDWLVKHRATLDCVAEKLVRKGCEAHLAYISDTEANSPTVKKLRIVREFFDVFPKELTGLPPNREMEFGIELLHGTTLMSIAPYRMTLKELVELKAQIQELLD